MKASDQYIYTRSGKRIDPTDIKPEDIDIKDIAYALAGINRYGGHSRITVAMHSVAAAWAAKELGYDLLTQQWALLHDAAEAYFGDVPKPMQQFVGEEWQIHYERCEDVITLTLMEGVFPPYATRREVKEIDHALVVPEMDDGPGYPEHGELDRSSELVRTCTVQTQRVWIDQALISGDDSGEDLFLEVAKELGIKGA